MQNWRASDQHHRNWRQLVLRQQVGPSEDWHSRKLRWLNSRCSGRPLPKRTLSIRAFRRSQPVNLADLTDVDSSSGLSGLSVQFASLTEISWPLKSAKG